MNCGYENQKFRQGFSYVIGCDEVGRACLAGPVVAAAVAFPVDGGKLKVHKVYKVIKDSKLLSPNKREELNPQIKTHALAFGIGVVSEKIIDEINIHHATLLAMRQAVQSLLCHWEGVHPTEAILSKEEIASPSRLKLSDDGSPRNGRILLVIDGIFKIPDVGLEQETIVGGDAKVLSVAAASIIAKVYRDDLMRQLHKKYPIYNLAQHKGYPTLYHRKMIKQNGLSKIHRLSFCKEFVK